MMSISVKDNSCFTFNIRKMLNLKLVIPSSHLILCHPFLLWPSNFPSIRVISNESALCIRWPKYWSFSISPSKEYSGLISFGIDWLDHPAVQGTLKSLLQHHSSKASILQRSAFFVIPLSHPYITTGKTIALTIWIFINKVMSLLFICCLGSIIANKAGGSDRIPAELFQILKKNMLLKGCTQYVSKFGKLSSGHRTGKGQFSFQSWRKAMPKNVWTNTYLSSFHMLAR